MWLLSVLEFTYMVLRDICINDTGLGGRKIDGINGYDKKYLKQRMSIDRN